MFRKSSQVLLFTGILLLNGCANDSEKNTTLPNIVPTKTGSRTIAKQDSSTADSIVSYNPKDTALLDSAIKYLCVLPEIKKENSYIDSFSQGKHGIAFLIDNPTKDEPYYSIHVGYNGDERFETYHLFFIYINKNSFKIRVLDPLSKNDDGTCTIEQWRKNLKKQNH